uniref:PFL domain-containing protein n=1 Tax=Heterorhabditis bacteriophora TaxID=37862 RepID=A0A1I7WRX9_HETBA
MSSAFDDILSRAEKLTSIGYQSKISCASASQETSIDGIIFDQNNQYLRSGLDNDLNNIFRCSEHLWRKSTSSTPIQKNFLFGDKGVVFGVSAPTLQDSVAVESVKDDNLQVRALFYRLYILIFSHINLQKAIMNNKTALLKNIMKNVRTIYYNIVQQYQLVSGRYGTVNPAVTSRRELIFGDKIRKYLRSGRKKDLSQLLGDAAKEGGTDGVLAGVWAETTAIINQKIVADRDDQTTIALLVEKACDYLHKL